MRYILKYLLVLILLLNSVGVVYAKDKLPVIKFNKSKFTLYYAAKNKVTGAYINEYYKKSQTYTTWNELIAVHEYDKAYSPKDKAREFSEYIANMGIVNTISEYDDDTAILDFIMVKNNQYPILLEYNVFKFVKRPVCGTMAIQYAKRYRVKNGIEADKIRRNLIKNRSKYIKKVQKLKISKVITEEIDKGKLIVNEGIDEGHYAEFK